MPNSLKTLPFNIQYSIDFKEIELTVEEIIKQSGDSSKDQTEYFKEAVSAALIVAAKISTVKASLSIHPVTLDSNQLYCKNTQLFLGKKIISLIKGSKWAAFFVATAGTEFQNQALKFQEEGKLLESYYIDLIGSMIVEKGMDVIQNKFKNLLFKSGLAISNRYSPGYCQWQVSEQHRLFALIEKNHTGVSLSDNALMSPIKSVSGLMGIGEEVRFEKHRCDLCNSRDCIYRKTE